MAYRTIPVGDTAPEVVTAVIEIPRGSHHKYEYDEQIDEIRLDRVLYSPVFYPTEYGFIPSTRAEDGDQLDVLVLISEPLFSGCVVSVRVIGMLDMEDSGGRDYKIVGVATKDPKLSHIYTIADMNDQYKKEIVHFFEEYKKLEDKWVKVHEWKSKEDAYRIIAEAIERFQKNG